MMLVAGDRKIMGAFAASRLLMIGGWAATALMAAAVAVMLIADFCRIGLRRRACYVSTIPLADPEIRVCPAPWGRAR